MRILHTIAGFGAKSGGTSTATYDLLRSLNQAADGKHTVDILSPDVNSPDDKIMGQGENWIKRVPNDCRTPLALSRNFSEALRQSEYDIYHINGLWLHANHATCAIARKKKCPYVITPHGMLYPAALRRSYWKKWPILHLWFKKDIALASAIHATCEEEACHLREFGYKGPIALIGNPVPENPVADALFNRRETSGEKIIGFLGRLHPIKKIERIIYAMALRPDLDLRLMIMGKGDESYEEFLRSESKRLNIDSKVEFAGFITGAEKYERLARLSALFVPSDMENFGMIIPEALMVGTPVMASLGTPWKILNDNRCGWWTDNTPDSIAKVIDHIMNLPGETLLEMGARGRDMIKQNFAASKVANDMLLLYDWLLNGGQKPAHVLI